MSQTDRLFVADITNHDLLDKSEELRLAKLVSRRQKLLDTGALTPAEAREVKEGEKARHKLIESNTRLVVHIMRRYYGRGVDFDDLFQDGVIGLTNAIDHYEYERGLKLSTYATYWIIQALGRSVADKSRTIRLPVHMHDISVKIAAISDSLSQELGRDATIDEIAARASLTPEKVQSILAHSATVKTVSLDQNYSNDPENINIYLKSLATPEISVSDPVERNQMADDIKIALEKLQPREQRILEMRYGLGSYQGKRHTLEECGRKFRLTRERIRQIEKDSIRKLRHPRRSRKLRGYL